MKVELTREEIEIIYQALEVWEKDPYQTGMLSMIIDTIVSPRASENKKDFTDRENKNRAKAEHECRLRKMSSIQIQSKLFTAAKEELVNVGKGNL